MECRYMLQSARMDAQQIQDRVFKRMSADKKLRIGAELWKLGKVLADEKISHANQRPTHTPRRHR